MKAIKAVVLITWGNGRECFLEEKIIRRNSRGYNIIELTWSYPSLQNDDTQFQITTLQY